MSGTVYDKNWAQQIPPRFHCHSLDEKGFGSMADAGKNYIGTSFTISWDLANQVMRLHNGVNKGGIGVVPIFPKPLAGAQPMRPFTPQYVEATLVDDVPVIIENHFGRYPMVQVIDRATGEVTTPTIIHRSPVAPSTTPTVHVVGTGVVSQDVFILLQ